MKTIKKKTRQAFRMSITLAVGIVFLANTIGATEVPQSESSDTAIELEMNIESWMMEPDTWTNYSDNMNLTEVAEEEIQLENWMHNPDNEFWSEIMVAEEEIQLEVWMSSPWNWNAVNQDQFLSFK